MAVRKTTPFIDGFDLWFPYAAVEVLYKALGVKSQSQFGKYFGKTGGLTNPDLEKIIYAGLFFTPGSYEPRESGVKLEDISKKLIPKFYDLGKGYGDLVDVVMKALGDAKIIDDRPYFRLQRKMDIMNEDRLGDLIVKDTFSITEMDEIIGILKNIYFGGSVPIPEPALEAEGAGDEEEGNEN